MGAGAGWESRKALISLKLVSEIPCQHSPSPVSGFALAVLSPAGRGDAVIGAGALFSPRGEGGRAERGRMRGPDENAERSQAGHMRENRRPSPAAPHCRSVQAWIPGSAPSLRSGSALE